MFRLTVTPEIELRLWDVADADIAFEAVARNRASLREWLPWVDRTHSAEDLRTYFRTIVTPQFDSNRSPNCGIWVDGEVAGSVGCHPIDWANRSCAMGYWLDEKFRGRGVMTKSCAAMLSHLFDNEKLHRVAIRCATGNTKSCAIPERLGFRREGLERDAEWVAGRWVDLWNWAILESEWPRHRPQGESLPFSL